MEEASEKLREVLKERAKELPPEMRRRLDLASQIVIFGSFASSLETGSSDLDVFCVGDSRTHFKSPTLEVLILPEYELFSDLWLGSELANHISTYGIPLGPRPEWFNRAYVSEAAAARKEKRIRTYFDSLQTHWDQLSPGARSRYETKLRRELQRLQLLRNGQPVPPTALLDGDVKLIGQMNTGCPSVSREPLFVRFRDLFAGISKKEWSNEADANRPAHSLSAR